MRHRAVITGFGVLAPNGIGVDAFWESLLAGRSGVKRITLFDTSNLPFDYAGEISDFDPLAFIAPEKKPQRMGRHTQFAVAATQMALKYALLTVEDLRALEPVPIVLGVSTSAVDILERGRDRFLKHGAHKTSPFDVGASQPQAISSTLGALLQLQLQSTTISSACAAGLQAIAVASDIVCSGHSPIALAGGFDSVLTRYAVATFAASRLVSKWPGDPAKASRPFDRDRIGGVLAEGGGIIVIEDLEHARARGAALFSEIRGHGGANDPHGSRAGTGFIDSMRLAMANARCIASDIDYVCAHGPSDRELDVMETEAIKQVLGAQARRIPVSSIKGCTGNPLSAAGPMEVIAATLALHHGMVPPTANFEFADPQCDLDYVPCTPRHVNLRRALVNVHGMGGGNASMVLERC